VYLKIFGQNQIQKIEVLRPRQFAEVENSVKTLKKSFGFLENCSVSHSPLQFLDLIFQSKVTLKQGYNIQNATIIYPNNGAMFALEEP
jgi:hypothetical protein